MEASEWMACQFRYKVRKSQPGSGVEYRANMYKAFNRKMEEREAQRPEASKEGRRGSL